MAVNVVLRQASLILFDNGMNIVRTNVSAAINFFQLSHNLYPTIKCAQILFFLFSIIFEWNEVQKFLQITLPDLYGLECHQTITQCMNEGIIAHRQSDFRLAISLFERVLELDPDHADAIFNRGNSYQHAGHIQLAAEMYYRTIELVPLHTKAILNLATLHHKFGQVTDSIPLYSSGIAITEMCDSNFPDRGITLRSEEYFMLLANMALACMQIGDIEQVLPYASLFFYSASFFTIVS